VGGHVPIVDPATPADTGTTVHSRDDEAPPRGLGVGLGIAVLAICFAVAFGAGRESAVETAVNVVVAQAGPAQAGAPPTTPAGRPLDGAFGVPYPNLRPRLGWKPVARRRDAVDGRGVRTLQYGRAGRRMAYSVVDGGPIPAPPGSLRVPTRGPEVVAFDSAGRAAVMTVRGGHSVVVSAVGVPRVALVRAARAG